MTTSLLADAVGHHVWATLRLLDACLELTPEQLASSVPGTYGSILDTFRHTVAADCSYLAVLTGERHARIESVAMDLPALRAEMAANALAWPEVLASNPDPDAILVRHRDDGTEIQATAGIRLAQAIHHGTDHRSQVCTALTNLGIEPPSIDVWDYGETQGRVVA